MPPLVRARPAVCPWLHKIRGILNSATIDWEKNWRTITPDLEIFVANENLNRWILCCWLTVFPFSWLMYCYVRAFYCLLRPKRACPLALACHGRHPCGVKQKSMGSRDKSAKSGSDIVLYAEKLCMHFSVSVLRFMWPRGVGGGGVGTAVLCRSEKKITNFHAFIFDRHRE